MSEDVILSKIFPIHEIFFSDETKHDGIFVRESYDAPAVITGWRTYELTNRWEGNLPMRWRSLVVTPLSCRSMRWTATSSSPT